jgi:hypothetical protein
MQNSSGQFIANHLQMIGVLKHNIDSIISTVKLAEADHGEAVSKYRLQAEALDKKLADNRQDIINMNQKVQADVMTSESGGVVDIERFKVRAETLLALTDATKPINDDVMKLVAQIGEDPVLAGSITAEFSLPKGLSDIPAGAHTSMPLALTNRQMVVLYNAKDIVDYFSRAASSAGLKRAGQDFMMGVIDQATGGNDKQAVKTVATFTPGKARINSSIDFTFGALWEFSAAPAESEDPTTLRTGSVFVTINDRSLYSRMYHLDAEKAEESYTEFVPDMLTPITAH